MILQISAPQFIKISAPGFSIEQFEMTISSVRILLFQLPLSVFLYLFCGWLTANKSFYGPNLIGIPLSITLSSVCLLLGTYKGVVGLSIASLLALTSQVFFLVFFLIREKFRLRISTNFFTPEIRASLSIFIPALLGSAIGELNAWVDKAIASGLSLGSVSAIGYASRLIAFAQGLVIFPMAGMLLSYMSD